MNEGLAGMKTHSCGSNIINIKLRLIHDCRNTSNIIGSVCVSVDNPVGIDIELDKIAFTAKYFSKKLEEKINPLGAEQSKIFGDFFIMLHRKIKNSFRG